MRARFRLAKKSNVSQDNSYGIHAPIISPIHLSHPYLPLTFTHSHFAHRLLMSIIPPPLRTATLVGTDRRRPRASPTDITFRALKAEWSPNDITCLLDVLKATHALSIHHSTVISASSNRVVNPSPRVHLLSASGLLGIYGGSPDYILRTTRDLSVVLRSACCS